RLVSCIAPLIDVRRFLGWKTAVQRASDGLATGAACKARAYGAPLRGLRGLTSSACRKFWPPSLNADFCQRLCIPKPAEQGFRFPFPHDPIGMAGGNGST